MRPRRQLRRKQKREFNSALYAHRIRTQSDRPGYVVTSVAVKQVPSYWVFSAMVKRPIGEKFEFQANLNNLLNRFYIDLPHPSHLVPSAGASALFGINFRFK